MESTDARYLSPEAQEAVRMRVMEAVRGGLRPAVAARTFGVSRSWVFNWRRRVALGNITSLRSKPRGRPKESRLKGHQAASVVRTITDRCPDQLKLPFALWTREAVQQLIAERFDIHVSVRTVGRYLACWGLTPQKPVRRAYEQNPQAVRRWLKEEYPAIARQAKAENAEIHWGDQTGLRSDHQAGRSYGRRGQTPVILGTGQRFGCNVMSTITNRGHLSFMVFKERFTAVVMIRFLRRLLRQVPRKVFLILDRHPVHRSARLHQWIQRQAPRLRLFFLPEYSPELNPDELLNQDLKTNALGRRRPATQQEMITDARSYLRSTQKQPAIIQAYFQEQHVRYAS
jgi:transposase